MTDQEIIALYWDREERAIRETGSKYGPYCRSIAWNILRDRSDAEECVNDTWLKAWNTMPPQRPAILSAFLGTITRNLSLDRWRAAQTQKRGRGQLAAALNELEWCVASEIDLEARITASELGRIIDHFLRQLPVRERCVFIRKYWYTDTVAEIAGRYHMSESAVKVMLHRTRKKLRGRLEKEGFQP